MEQHRAFAIRLALPDDYGAISGLLAESDELHRRQLPWLFHAPASEPRPADFSAALVKDGGAALFVAAADSIVGAATVLIKSAPEFAVFIPQTRGVLDSIAVAVACRRCGIGTALTRACEEWAQTRGAKWLELNVYDFNDAARAFYAALGYSAVSSRLRKAF